MKSVCSLLLFLLASAMLTAQHKCEVGMLIGTALYQGDLAEHSFPKMGETELAYGLFVRQPLNGMLSVRANLFHAQLNGDDANFSPGDSRRERNLRFTTPVTQLAVELELDLFRAFRIPGFTPYLSGGLGVSFIDPDTDYSAGNLDGGWTDRIKADQGASYSRTLLTVPIGGGLKVNVERQVTLGFELRANSPFTDYLDGVSKAGNNNKRDWYWLGNISLAYRFESRGAKCPWAVDR